MVSQWDNMSVMGNLGWVLIVCPAEKVHWIEFIGLGSLAWDEEVYNKHRIIKQ